MAFVFRQEHDPYPKSHTPGPSHYQPQRSTKLQKPLPVPFNQSSPRKIWEKNNIPGPGSYNATINTDNNRLLVQQNGKLFLMNSKTQSFNFKSTCERFKAVQNKLPGPGQYQTLQTCNSNQFNKKKREKSACNKNNLQKYLLMTHNQQAEGKPVKLEIILDKQSNLNSLVKLEKGDIQKKKVPFNSSVQRNIKNRPQTSLGPGSYNVPNLQAPKDQLARIKPSYSLAKFKKIVGTEEDKQWLQNQQNQQKIHQQRNVQEYSNSNTYKKKKDDFFGSTVGRFVNTQSGNIPGPGSYDVTNLQTKHVKKQKNKLAFGRVYSPEKTQIQTIFSPFVDLQSFFRKTEQKSVQKPKNWNFGSNEPRFKQKNTEAKEKRVEFTTLNICIGRDNFGSSNKENNKSKSKLKLRKQNNETSKRHTFNQKDEKDDRPLSYAPQVNTIAKKLGQRHQANAPFSSQATRFAQVDREMNIIEDLLNQSQRNVAKQNRRLQKKVQPKGLMDSSNPRFQYKDLASNISPCSYDPSKPTKKEFNRLFL